MRIVIPTHASEIKLHEYQQYVKVVESNPNVSQFLKHKTIEIFCHVPLKVSAQMTKRNVDDIYNVIMKTIDTDIVQFQQRFDFVGKEFGFIPDFENMTSGEYMDLSEYIKSWDTMHKAMAVLFRPIVLKKGSKYLIDDYTGSETWSSVMLNLPLDKALGAVFFLTSSFKQLSRDTLQYLKEQAENNQEFNRSLSKSGVGTTQFISALEATSSVLTR